MGSLWAWLAYLVLALWLSPAQIGWLIAASIPVGWWACTVTAKHMRVADPGHIVWDEVVAMWIVLWLCTPMGFWGQLTCFALFRFLMPSSPSPSNGPTACSKASARAAAGGIMG